MMLYLRMIACWLEHTRLFNKVYKNTTVRVKMSVSSTKGRRGRRKKEEKSIKARRVRKEGPFVVHRQSIVSVIAKSNGTYIDAHFLASYSARTNSPRSVHRLVATLARHHGVSAAAKTKRKKKKAQNKEKKSLSSFGNRTAHAYQARPPLALSFG